LWGGRIARIDGGIRLRDIGGFLGQLLLRSFDRAGRVYQAMECRGFDGVCRGPGSSPWRPSDWLYTLGVSGLALAFRFFNGSQFLGRLIGNRSFIR
jgi:cobalt/nickel transport system permease protein